MNQQEKNFTEINNMEEFQNTKTPRKYWDMNSSFIISFPRDINVSLLKNHHDYLIVGTVEIRFSKLEKNNSLLFRTVKKIIDDNYFDDCFEVMSEDDDYYYLYFQNPDMLNCFSFMDLYDELSEVENSLKTFFKDYGLEDYEMLFNIEAYNHGF